MKYHIYYVYILKCIDGSFYTGVTNSLDRRLEEHSSGNDPKCYTYTRRPVELLYNEMYQMVTDAISREKQIKRWSRKKKEALIRGDYEVLKTLAIRRSKV